MQRLLRQSHEEGCRRVVIVGGDGSIHRAINLLRQSRHLAATEVGLVPGGTCNDFARGMGLSPKAIAEAFDISCRGTPLSTDLGQLQMANQAWVYLNNAGFGRRLSVTPQKRTSALKTLRSFEATNVKVSWEKGQIEGIFFMLMACNAPYFSRGLFFSKNPRVNDGLLDVFMVPAMARWKLLPLLLKGRFRRPVGNRQTLTLKVQKIDIETDRDVWPQMDGEPTPGAVRRLSFSVAPEKVMIVVPAKSKSVSLWN